MAVHFDRNRSEKLGRLGVWEQTGAACGATIVGAKYAASTTDVEAAVTCKRCLKTIETGSARTGWLAGTGVGRAAGNAR